MKQDRIELRASQKERERLSEAAMLTGMTLSAFLRLAALEKSDEILRERNTLTLSEKDRDMFLEALENASKPNQRLQKAFKTYRGLRSGGRIVSPVKRAGTRTRKAKTTVV